jgi:hypothetical protein
MSLESEFNADMREIAKIADQHGYYPTIFIQMLGSYGGVGTARRLLAEPKAQSGLFRLYDLNLLHASMEAYVIMEKYASLFTSIEISEAHKRLEELNYFG